jgi:cell division protein FtsW (lipid II flippase)
MLTWLFLGRLYLSTLATALASFYPYLLALFSVVFETEQEWAATNAKKTQKDVIMKWIWPHVFLVTLGLLSLVVGWYEPRNFWTTLFNTVWVAINTYLLILFLTGERRIVALDDRNNQ